MRPDGRFVAVASQRSRDISVFLRNSSSGHLLSVRQADVLGGFETHAYRMVTYAGWVVGGVEALDEQRYA